MGAEQSIPTSTDKKSMSNPTSKPRSKPRSKPKSKPTSKPNKQINEEDPQHTKQNQNSNVQLSCYKLNIKPIKLLELDHAVSDNVRTQNTNNQLINNTTLYLKITNNIISGIYKTQQELIDETTNLLFNVDTNIDDLDFREKMVHDIVSGRLNAIDSIKNKYGVTFRLPFTILGNDKLWFHLLQEKNTYTNLLIGELFDIDNNFKWGMEPLKETDNKIYQLLELYHKSNYKCPENNQLAYLKIQDFNIDNSTVLNSYKLKDTTTTSPNITPTSWESNPILSQNDYIISYLVEYSVEKI